MDRQRLADIVAAYGAASERWPASERAAAEALVANSAEARKLVEDARELDTWLDAAPDVVPSMALVSRVLAARPIAAQAEGKSSLGDILRALARIVWPYGPPIFPAGALAMSAVLGLTFGLVSPVTISILGTSATTAATASASGTTGDQLVSLALADIDYPEEWQK